MDVAATLLEVAALATHMSRADAPKPAGVAPRVPGAFFFGQVTQDVEFLTTFGGVLGLLPASIL